MQREPIPFLELDLRQRWPVPSRPRPIVIIGAGGIVNEAHLPAYRALGLDVAAIFDIDQDRARTTAAKWGIPVVLPNLAEVAAIEPPVCFDVATPPDAHRAVLDELPRGSAVLFQKPLGFNLAEATHLRDTCHQKHMIAAVNFQHRFSPAMLALADAMDRGMLGEVCDVDVRTNVNTPWHLWPFLQTLDRMEIALHSIHYIDSIRHLIGTPQHAMARTLPHSAARKIASTRSSVILDFGETIRCSIVANHHHAFGPRHQASELRIEGTGGAAVLSMGVNLDYPQGQHDWLEITNADGEWRCAKLVGSWFVDGFRGPMSNIQRYLAAEDDALMSSVDDAWHTMAVVEACYESDAAGGAPVPMGNS